MNSKPTLKDILLKDAANAKSSDLNTEVLPAGTYPAKILGFVEEDTYQYVTVEINKKKYNFFYNYFLKDTTTLNADLLNWMKALSTIPVADTTSLLEIANSAIGSTYKIVIYNYTSKAGKNAGKAQHAISFKDLPVIDTVVIQTEDVELPF